MLNFLQANKTEQNGWQTFTGFKENSKKPCTESKSFEVFIQMT